MFFAELLTIYANRYPIEVQDYEISDGVLNYWESYIIEIDRNRSGLSLEKLEHCYDL